MSIDLTSFPAAGMPRDKRSVREIVSRSIALFRSTWILGLVDQGAVSASNFLMLVLVGRANDLAELGIFATAFSILIVASAVQDALVSRPYTISIHKPDAPHCQRLADATISNLILSVAALATGMAIAVVFLLLGGSTYGSMICLCVGIVLAFFLMREFARRHCFAHGRLAMALLIDLAAALIALGGAVVLAIAGALTALTALALIGLANMIAVAIWVAGARKEFKGAQAATDGIFRDWQRLGLWFLLGQLAIQVQGYALPWVTMIAESPARAGLLSIATSVVGLCNPVLTGLFNILMPKAVHRFQAQGMKGLLRGAVRDALVIGIIMGLFVLLMIGVGEHLAALLFGASSFADMQILIAILSVAAAIGAIGTPASIALSAAEGAREVGCSMGFIALLSVGAAAVLLPAAGLIAAVWGFLIVETVGCGLRWAMLVIRTRAS